MKLQAFMVVCLCQLGYTEVESHCITPEVKAKEPEVEVKSPRKSLKKLNSEKALLKIPGKSYFYYFGNNFSSNFEDSFH